MSTAIEHQQEQAHSEEHPLADVSLLQDRVPEYLQVSRYFTIWIVIFGAIYLCLSFYPLWHTDVWGHLAYGEFIIQNQTIPETEPLMPLSQGMPFRDTAWLSQVIGSMFYSQFGVAGLRFLFAIPILCSLVLLAYRFEQKSKSIWLSLLGMGLFMAITWKAIFIIRPQLIGLTCFISLLVMLTNRKISLLHWIAIPILFAAWANLHGSFIMGLVLLGVFTLGRAIDLVTRRKTIDGLLKDSRFQQLFLLTQCAVLASFFNPYGVGIYPAILSISQNPNMADLVEWDPVTLKMYHGKVIAFTTVIICMLLRWTPRRISSAEMMGLLLFGLASLWSVRMTIWWAPIACWFVVTHLGALVHKHWSLERCFPSLKVRNGMNTAIALGLCWIFFAYTPFGLTLLHGQSDDTNERQRTLLKSVSKQTPVAACDYLKELQPQGLIFNSYEWGDYLLFQGDPQWQLFLNSHAHLVPRLVWIDYLTIANTNTGWDSKLDRYGVNTICIDKLYRTRLIESLNRSADWKLEYEDSISTIYVRRKPI